MSRSLLLVYVDYGDTFMVGLRDCCLLHQPTFGWQQVQQRLVRRRKSCRPCYFLIHILFYVELGGIAIVLALLPWPIDPTGFNPFLLLEPAAMFYVLNLFFSAVDRRVATSDIANAPELNAFVQRMRATRLVVSYSVECYRMTEHTRQVERTTTDSSGNRHTTYDT